MGFKVRPETILKWTKALRSGEYKQTTASLQDNNGYCCLGVACKVFIPEHKLILKTPGSYSLTGHSVGQLVGGIPNEQCAPEWLKKINDHFTNKTGSELIDLNDSEKYNFNEIADALEAVYVHKVLK